MNSIYTPYIIQKGLFWLNQIPKFDLFYPQILSILSPNLILRVPKYDLVPIFDNSTPNVIIINFTPKFIVIINFTLFFCFTLLEYILKIYGKYLIIIVPLFDMSSTDNDEPNMRIFFTTCRLMAFTQVNNPNQA